MWSANTEGAKFWLHMLTELKNRGVRDYLDWMRGWPEGFPQSMETVFPATQVQLCLVDMVRHSLSYVALKRTQSRSARFEANLSGGDAPRGRTSADEF